MDIHNQEKGVLKTFREAVQSKPLAISAELTVERNAGAKAVREQAQALSGAVDGIQIPDNPFAWVQMSATSVACILLEEGVDPVPALCCRDRNRIALKSDLLGLHLLGVSSVLLTRGNPLPENHQLPARPVFDLGGRELVAMAGAMNEELPAGEKFFIGTGAKAFRPKRGWTAEALRARAAAGAEFVQTQLCFDMDILRHYMARMVSAKVTWDYSVMVSLAALPSAVTARWLKSNLKDSRIPDEIIERLERANDPQLEGISICAELMQQITEIPGISGVNLMTMGNPEAILASIAASGLRPGIKC